MMLDQKKSQFKKLTIWFSLNLIIFLSCYLNYRLQLKHRYLFKTLNVGLCLSRAAAMVINFNLLLVWLPMCKYTLTRLGYLANGVLSRHKHTLDQLMSSPSAEQTFQSYLSIQHKQPTKLFNPTDSSCHQVPLEGTSSSCGRLIFKLKWSLRRVGWRCRYWLCITKINYINSFLIAIDHCTSLHTICATTITLASVIHTVAHLMNVINFSRNFDPLLSNLNMAEYKGQNPFHLLVSVPGITGCLMIVILLLMSLSSTDLIRNSSYDLFQIFHRLSVVFVLLLILHPISHVLKEQSNVDRHNPEICYHRMVSLFEQGNSSSHHDLSTTFSMNNTNPLPTIVDNTSGNAHSSSTANGRQMLERRTRAPPGDAPNLAPNSLVRSFGELSPVASGAPPTVANSISASAPANINLSNRNLDHYRAFNGTDRPIIGTVPGQVVVNNHNDHLKIINQEERPIKPSMDPSVNNSNKNKTSGGNITFGNGQQRIKVERTIRSQGDDKANADEIGANVVTILDNYVSGGGHKNNRSSNNLKQSMLSLDSPTNDCPDTVPLFVAQSSVCWYVLIVGLSFYLTDLLLRRWRRSKNTIQLLDARLDSEGNLIELVLSNNHKRFAHWLPGQFVYLNCPQIAAYEWHPFTISTMDNGARKFTLHIKTGGDWTRKLRHELELRSLCLGRESGKSMSLFDRAVVGRNCGLYLSDRQASYSTNQIIFGHRSLLPVPSTFKLLNHDVARFQVAGLDCYDGKTGRSLVECRKISTILTNDMEDSRAHSGKTKEDELIGDSLQDQCLKVDLSNGLMAEDGRLMGGLASPNLTTLELFVDGPFHSPFERLLQQQVSVCISNGVGWTAFSSIFQRITNETSAKHNSANWWSLWHPHYMPRDHKANIDAANALSIVNNLNSISPSQQSVTISSHNSCLHLMVIVATLDQLRPFYEIALQYFTLMSNGRSQQGNSHSHQTDNPIKEVKAFVTRSTFEDRDIIDFCQRENLSVMPAAQSDSVNPSPHLMVNEVFSIHFGKPDFGTYLSNFNATYSDKRKISVYCCGSYQVKRVVEKICQDLNKVSKGTAKSTWTTTDHHEQRHRCQQHYQQGHCGPIYSYHEENF